jgi:hypothetical protein
LDSWPGLLTYIGVLAAIAGLFLMGVAKRDEENMMNNLENVAYTKLLRKYECGTRPNEIEQEMSVKV